MPQDWKSLMQHDKVTEDLVRAIPDDCVNDTVYWGFAEWTALAIACRYAAPTIVRWLLVERGADPNKVNANHFAPIHTLVLYTTENKIDAVRTCLKLLLVAGAKMDIEAAGSYGNRSCLVMALGRQHWLLVLRLIYYGAVVRKVDWSHLPHYLRDIISGNNRCRAAARVLLGLRRYRVSVLNTNDAHVIWLIGEHVFRTRGDAEWRK